MTDVRAAVREYVVKEFKPKVPLDYDTPLIQQGIIDSLAVLMLIGFLDERFGIRIDPEAVRLESFETINAIQALAESAGPPPPPAADRNKDAV
jgi:acyl carrier protein